MAADSVSGFNAYFEGVHAAATRAHEQLCGERDAAIQSAHTARGEPARQTAVECAFQLTYDAVVLARMVADGRYDRIDDRCPMAVGAPDFDQIEWLRGRGAAARARMQCCETGTALYRENREIAELNEAWVSLLERLAVLKVLYPTDAAEDGDATDRGSST